MSRPKKWRKVCCMPENLIFGPIRDDGLDKEVVNLTVDEYEVLRLIDFVGLDQEKCAEKINVSRTTVQGIYNRARKKIAESLVMGKQIAISGGEFKLCDGHSENCNYGCNKIKKDAY